MSNNLKKIMEKKKVSLDDMAKKCDVSVTTVRNWRKAESLKRKKALIIAEVLNVYPEDII